MKVVMYETGYYHSVYKMFACVCRTTDKRLALRAKEIHASVYAPAQLLVYAIYENDTRILV